MTTARPDWYDDPRAEDGGLLRYWDGSRWTEHVHDVADGQPPAVPSVSSTGTRDASRRPATVPRVGARRFARGLIDENDALNREVTRLYEVIDLFGVKSAVERTIALEDLGDEIAAQECRLKQLIAQVHETESRIIAQAREDEAERIRRRKASLPHLTTSNDTRTADE